MPQLRVIGDRLLVRPLAPEETGADRTAAGIVLPEQSTDRPTQGIVLAVGDGRGVPGVQSGSHFEENPPVTPGEHVLYGKYAGVEIVGRDGAELKVLRFSDILAVYEPDEEESVEVDASVADARLVPTDLPEDDEED